MTYTYFDRDLSWLAFNERVLMEAAHESVPLLERIRFLSIYSSNLDEFYRVRMPVIKGGNHHRTTGEDIYHQAYEVINRQQERFGHILEGSLIPALRKHHIHFCYKEGIPAQIVSFTTAYFFTHIAAFLQPVLLTKDSSFFPENNALYLVSIIQHGGEKEQIYLINIPAGNLKRFVRIVVDSQEFIVFLEDIIKDNLRNLFPDATGISAFNIKITRDADLGPMEEFGEDLAEQFEKQLSKRDSGFATRLLYEPDLPQHHLDRVITKLGLQNASVVSGGRYHNLKDLSDLPVKIADLQYPSWPTIESVEGVSEKNTLFKVISQEDVIIHAPYQSYNTILRFFNEASIDDSVHEIYTTLYRVAQDSMIVQALISARRMGKR